MLDQTWEYTLFGIPQSLKVTLSKEATDMKGSQGNRAAGVVLL